MKLTHQIIHCTATPEGMEVTSDMLKQWHLGPAKIAGGRLKYKGVEYNTVFDLPDESIGGVHISKLIGGRGWRQVGYSDILHLDGTLENIVPYNEDDEVDPWELTNGILYANPLYKQARHIVYAGGMDKTNKYAKDTRTIAQKVVLKDVEFKLIENHPDIFILGHNQIDYRACPSFNVPKWLREIGIPEKNISDAPLVYPIQ